MDAFYIGDYNDYKIRWVSINPGGVPDEFKNQMKITFLEFGFAKITQIGPTTLGWGLQRLRSSGNRDQQRHTPWDIRHFSGFQSKCAMCTGGETEHHFISGFV